MTETTQPSASTDPLAQRLEVRRATGDDVVEVEREQVFDVEDVSVSYGSFRASDVTISIARNEITALIGPSGCGKTTFLRCLNRMNDLIENAKVEGTILYHGVDLYDAASTRSRSAGGSGWSSRSPTRSRSRSTTT